MKIYQLPNKLISTIVLCVIAVSCQKGADVSTSVAGNESNSLSASGCQTQGVSIADAKIVGADGLVSDQKTVLSLDTNVNCDQAQKAQWSVGNLPLGQGSQVKTTIKGTGVYYINVKSDVDGQDSSRSPATSKVSVTSVSQNSVRVAVTDSNVMLTGSQVGVEFNSYTFSLVVPTNITLKTADWNFNDGSALSHSLTTETHSFMVGVHSFSVIVTDSNNKVTTLQHTITILPIGAGIDCTADQLATLEITGATQVPMSEAMDYALNEPSCIQNSIQKLSWNFGDASASASTPQVEHTYAASGDYKIAVSIWLNTTSGSPTFVVTRDVNVIDVMEQFPGPDPGNPDPNACATSGATRTVDGSQSTKEAACGLNGTRTDTYKDQIIQICQSGTSGLTWVEQSRSQVLVSQGDCHSQSCQLQTENGTLTMTDGQTMSFYADQNPTGTCVAVSRTCNNNVLSGSTAAHYTTCQNGCGDFGVNGTVKVGVVIGSVTAPVQCAYGETGVVDTYSQITDQKCVNGSVNNSNTRQGDLQSKGACPVYSWSPTDSYGACSADCGGQQSRIYSCVNDHGLVSDQARCTANVPVDTRVCDGNPAAVRQSTSTSVDEEANSSVQCPKNQIGVIVNDRTTTTTVTVACIDHKIQQESSVVTSTPWVANSYCRDFVPMRCSQDSLSNTDAAGRYAWMVKCENQVPVIKQFLDDFANVKYNGISLNDSTRHLYPTFLDSKTNKPWIAPKVATGSCVVPSTAYVAAVCVSSCATPEQEILAEIQSDKALRKVSFIEAYTQKLAKVGTMSASSSSIRSTTLQKTEVDNWVTELLDTTQPVLTFQMKSGGSLRVTLNHPLLNKDGAMQLANEFKAGDYLVQLGGRADQIVSISQADYYGKVYNLFVKSAELKKNIVVINGYLSGTAFYQNEGAQYMNRDLFRRNLTRGVFDQ